MSIKDKLTSRKLWMTVITVILEGLIVYFADNATVQAVAAAALAWTSTGYCKAEAAIDTASTETEEV